METGLLNLDWGLQPPPDAVLAWGARAIYRLATRDEKFFANGKRRKQPKSVTSACIDLLWDRQSLALTAEADGKDAKALTTWIDKVGLPNLRKLCEDQFLTSDSEDHVEFERDGYAMKASPRASYGYLYITAWVALRKET